MTSFITKWQLPPSVKAIQTSRDFNHTDRFDLNPVNKKQQLITQFIQDFHLPHEPMLLKQTHSDKLIELMEPPTNDYYFQADACFTREKNTICAVLSADCLIVLLTDKNASMVAAIHCGWRSLYQNIIQKTIQRININNKNITAWLGPCISSTVYEVDAEFVTNFISEHPNCKECFSTIIDGKSFANLRKIAQLQLTALNVKQISGTDDCTVINNNKYYSWRKNQTSQRMASLIWIDG